MGKDSQSPSTTGQSEGPSNDIAVIPTIRTGRPTVRYIDASAASKRRMKGAAKVVISDMVKECDRISKGCGKELLVDVIEKTPLKDIQQTANEGNRVNKLMEEVHKSYRQADQNSGDKIRLLSTIANHFSNKELKKVFSCTDYEIMKARRHAKFIGAGVIPRRTHVTKYRIPVQDIAFVVNFLHRPDNVTRSSHRMASCQGKNSSWLSDLFEEKSQPVMWLKNSPAHLYSKYREECKTTGRRPISETKFRDGLKAGNFREMAQMVGLCNICDEVGARNWDTFEELVKELSEEVSNTAAVTTSKYDEDNDDQGNKGKVVMVDISEQEVEHPQWNPLPPDFPILMVPVGITSKLDDYATNKDNVLDNFCTRAIL